MGKPVSREQPALAQRLATIVGPENIITESPATKSYEVDGFTPSTVVFAATTEQVSQIIQVAHEFETPIIPWGSGSKQQVGPCLSAADTILCLKNMNQTTELDASNFTVQVEAGMVNAQLQKQLAGHKLFFPFDPPYRETSTIGGELATNASGPLRFKYGAVRDLVLGLTVVTPTGDIIHSGGKTMKNVAGIDLSKLFIGSWGTLGVITQAVLRLFPLPEVSKTILITFASFADAFSLVARLLNSPLIPSALELLDRVAGHKLGDNYHSDLANSEVLIMVKIEGIPEDVARHLKDIHTIANRARQMITFEGEEATQVWKAYHRVHQLILSDTLPTLQGKASVPISKLGDICHAVKKIGENYGVEIGLRAHAGNGILYPYVAAENEVLVRLVEDFRQAATNLAGFFSVETAPLAVRKKAAVWPQRNDYPLMKRLKTEFDPRNILNPGRVVGGLS